MDTKELLHIAYKKLKSNVFFDKTQLPLRDKIALFEAGKFEKILDNLADEINSGFSLGVNKFGDMSNKILNNINCYIVPKELQQDDTKKKIKAYFNLPKAVVDIEKCQFYIDMDVLGHVLGIAWILVVGSMLDKEGYENSYGNRLKKHLYKKGKPTFSPYLFEPYFSQYETWRDQGLEQAKKLLSNNKNVIMMTLDFSRFYYSVDIKQEEFNKIVSRACEDKQFTEEKLQIIWTLTEFVFKVIEIYSEKVRCLNKELVGNRNILPIGFAPSNILSNYCLKGFDEAIIKGWNPTYFGRYVDDVLIIDKVEKNSPIFKAVSNQEISTEQALEYFLVNNDAWRKQYGLTVKAPKLGLFYIDKSKKKSKSLPKGERNNNKTYIINNDFLDFKGCKISLQNKKAKVFYFDSSQSDILLRCFQKNLQKNISEFRYMPEDEPIFNFNDYTEIYKIRENSGPNKLNGVDEFGLDKFELSKFLGKYMRISSLVKDTKEFRFKKDIDKIFTHEVTIENYSAWEKIFAILINNEYFNELDNFVEVILKSIDSIEYVGLSNGDSESIKIKTLIKKSLIDILYSGLNRSLSLVWGKKMSDIIHDLEVKILKFRRKFEFNIEREIGIEEIRHYYCLSRMCDKYAMPFVIDEVIAADGFCLKDDGDLINLTSFHSFMECLSDLGQRPSLIERQNNYIYYPYIFSVIDLTFANMVDSLINENDGVLNYNSEILYRLFNRLNYNNDKPKLTESKFYLEELTSEEKISTSMVKVGTGEFEKIKIAVANTELSDNLLIDLLRNSVNRTYQRYDNLVNMVNEAISNQASMLVLPEGYLPMDWLPIFARTCAKNQMAAVVGVEHFAVKDHVYNITATILPYMEDEYKYAYIHFHKKTHYAPHEKTIIESTGKKIGEGNKYTLFNWNDFWFPVYCCYELASIKDRAMFQSFADAIIAVEWNMDVNYYSNIVESLSRDLHCYCIQVNMSKYGDSRITQPTKTDKKDLLRVKGGKNSIVLIDEININELREFQLLGNTLQNDSKEFKPTPPDFDYDVVRAKKDNRLWDALKNGKIKIR